MNGNITPKRGQKSTRSGDGAKQARVQASNNLRLLRERKGWTIAEAAERFGMSRGGYIKLERGERKLSVEHFQRGFEIYEIPPMQLPGAPILAEVSDEFWLEMEGKYPEAVALVEAGRAHERAEISRRAADRADQPEIPVYVMVRGQAKKLVQFAPVRFEPRPGPLLSVRGAYGLYIIGDEMSPAYEQGDMVLVNPHLPPKAGDDILLFGREPTGKVGDEVPVVFARLIQLKVIGWTVHQHSPPVQFSLPFDDWPRPHVVVGKFVGR